jgi:hypothetical protein
MNKIFSMAALCLSAAVFVGCDSKDNTAVTPPPAPGMTSSATTVAPVTPAAPSAPAMPDVSKATNAMDNAIDKGSTSVKSAADKLMTKAPTTAPSMPEMPAMPK